MARLATIEDSAAAAAPATFESLHDRLASYLDAEGVARVGAAYEYARDAHEGQMRRSGHPYITHPLAVADTLAAMRMDAETIMAALLHDVIEDTSVSHAILSEQFGEPVADLVDGVSKLSTIFQTRAEAQAENFQKMVLAMSRDIRVILVKIADRLHNMRTLYFLGLEKRKRIARETVDFYAPIAHRIGMHDLKVELEDLAFGALYPMRCERIARAVVAARGNRKQFLEDIRQTLEDRLASEPLPARISYREKHVYSIYQKMRTQRKSFADIMDVFGFRILTDSMDNCYRTLGVIHNLYKPVHMRFKDYIAIPKANGYQSLHTTLFGMHGITIEIQIRTEEMNDVATNGIAGHWMHTKEPKAGQFGRTQEWVQNILELQQRADSSTDFIEHLKVDLFPDEVFLFTPAGKILQLPRGACPVDFAYAVHTEVGNRCVACRVDRELRPLSTALRSGQTVEILTADAARPKAEWLSFARTSKARAAIRQTLKTQQRDESVALGRRLLTQALATYELTLKDFDFRRLRRVFIDMGVRRLDDLLAEIGLGNRLAYMVARHLVEAGSPNAEPLTVANRGPLAIRGSEGLLVSYGRCCNPIPGDAIAGRVSPGTGLVVHIETCPNLQELRRKSPSAITAVVWDDNVQGDFLCHLQIEVPQRKGILAEVARVLSQTDAGIQRLNVTERNPTVSTISAELMVENRSHLARVMRRLRHHPNVATITRTIS